MKLIFFFAFVNLLSYMWESLFCRLSGISSGYLIYSAIYERLRLYSFFFFRFLLFLLV